MISKIRHTDSGIWILKVNSLGEKTLVICLQFTKFANALCYTVYTVDPNTSMYCGVTCTSWVDHLYHCNVAITSAT